MKYLLGIDFGGGASKATLIDTDGRIIADNTVEYETLYPEVGASEQNPADWISALAENTKALLSKSEISAEDILAVALDSATHTSLVCDENKRPLRNAIHWTDTRSRKQADKLREEMGEEIFKKPSISPILSGPYLSLSGSKRPSPKPLIRQGIFSSKRTISVTILPAFSAPTISRPRAVCSSTAIKCSGMKSSQPLQESAPICCHL